MKREDDFEVRRMHLADLSEEQLENRFWELCYKIVDPLVELSKYNTSPSIERSVLLRMGFSSIESKKIVDKVVGMNLLGKGAGNVVYRLSNERNIDIHDAGCLIINEDLESEIKSLFNGGEIHEA
jgi:D-ornithine 4,5-aminomutase subunit alpha